MGSDVVFEVTCDPEKLIAILDDAFEDGGLLVLLLVVHVIGLVPTRLDVVQRCPFPINVVIQAYQNVIKGIVHHSQIKALFLIFQVTLLDMYRLLSLLTKF